MIYQGNGVSKGIAFGEIFLYQPAIPKAQEACWEAGDASQQLRNYEELKARARGELCALSERLRQQDPEKSAIFEAHMEILNDEELDGEIRDGISRSRWMPDWAIERVYAKYAAILSKAKDPMIQERVADLEDVKKRLLRIWTGGPKSDLSTLNRPVVVAARDLLPSDTATMDRANVLAIVTETGGSTSHSAIIARSFNIPAILGVQGLLGNLRAGQRVVVDAVDGQLIIDPDCAQEAAYLEKQRNYLEYAQTTAEYLDREPLTKDGRRIEIGLNLGSVRPDELEGARHTGFLGLLRTEFLYMDSDHLPTETEQFEAYKKALLTYGSRPVVLRTLDIGGDKTLGYLPLPKEENPFLGSRALRFCFAHPAIFRTQLRAALRASAYGNLWIMFPMVGSMEDLRKANAFLQSVRKELRAEGEPFSNQVKTGIMIEIPSIALMADAVVQEVDFVSIGTNDLCQYLTAADRMNPTVSAYYQAYHPALFRLIAAVVRPFAKAGKPVCICGELAGDPLAAPVLAGLGIQELSMSLRSIAEVKQALSKFTFAQMQRLAQSVMKSSTAEEAERFMRVQAAESSPKD